MEAGSQYCGLVRFGTFVVDFRAGELLKQGVKIRLQEQALRVLALLLERPGEVVTREELKRAIWPADTFVDFDTGLDGAVYRLRQALGDTAENPRFVETLPRHGYRFIAPVSEVRTRHDDALQTVAPPAGIQAAPADSAAGEVSLVEDAVERDARPLVSSKAKGHGFPGHGHRRWLAVGIAVLLLVIVAEVLRRPAHSTPLQPIIVVLPFKNLSSEPGSDYFSDGLTDEIIRNFSIIEGLQVKSRTSSFEFKDKPRNMHEVGSKLGVNLVLEGSVLRSGDKLRIDAQLIRVADDVSLWSGRYDRELKDVFAIQDEISRSIVNELRLKNVGGQRRYDTNLEAYELYLKATALENLNSRPHAPLPGRPGSNFSQSIDLYQQVIAKDPNFAPAYAGMAMAYAALSMSPPQFDAAFADAQMRTAAEKAVQLDPLLPEAYEAMGLAHSRELAWADAEKDFRRALQLNPNLSVAHVDLAFNVYHPMGRFDEGVLELKKALELDPLSLSARRTMAYLLLSAHRYDEAMEYCRQIAAVASNDFFGQQFTGRALLGKGKFGEAIPIFEKQGENSQHLLGYAYVQVGRRADARQIIERNHGWPARQVVIYAALGDKDHAFAALAQMAAMQDLRVDQYPFFLEMSSLRFDPRMKEFRRQRGLAWNP